MCGQFVFARDPSYTTRLEEQRKCLSQRIASEIAELETQMSESRTSKCQCSGSFSIFFYACPLECSGKSLESNYTPVPEYCNITISILACMLCIAALLVSSQAACSASSILL